MSVALNSSAADIAAAQRVRINFEDISKTLQREDHHLASMSKGPICPEELQKIFDVITNVGMRLAVIRRTGVATGKSGEHLAQLCEAQREMIENVREKVEERVGSLTQMLRLLKRSITFMETSIVPLAGSKLKKDEKVLTNLKEEIAGLTRILPSISKGEIRDNILANLTRLRKLQVELHAQVQERINAISNLSVFSHEGLRLPFDLSSRIGSFVGPLYKTINTFTRDDVRNPKLVTRPELNGFVIAFQNADDLLDVTDDDIDYESCALAFKALKDAEAERMSQLLWIAMARPDPLTFNAKQAIREANYHQLKEAATQSLAWMNVVKFHETTRNYDFSNLGDDERLERAEQAELEDWVLMGGRGSLETDGAEVAKNSIMEAIWILRGLTNPRGERIGRDELTFSNTVSLFDPTVHVACCRLSMNNLLLLEKQQDRNAIQQFVASLTSVDQNSIPVSLLDYATKLREAYSILKAKSLGAAKLLAFAVGNGVNQDPKTGERCILTAENQELLEHITAIAQQLSFFENGRPFHQLTGGILLAPTLVLVQSAAPAGSESEDPEV